MDGGAQMTANELLALGVPLAFEEDATDAGLGYQNGVWEDDPDEEIEEYFDWAEAAAFERARKREALEEQLQALTTPGWGFLFAMDEHATPDQVAELQAVEAAHFKKHATKIRELKNAIEQLRD